MKKIFLILIILNICVVLYAQIPPGYYDGAQNLNGLSLKNALHNIIKNHNVISYSAIYSVLQYTDNKGNNQVWDIYSDNPFGTPPYIYYYTNPSDQCGQYSGEGDCYNKEHSWPQSWFDNTSSPIYSDLFNIYPTDGYVNSKRSNYPYGEVNNASWTSQNGSKLGNCVFPGYSSVVFEPIDEYKGDIARSFFYITVRYYGEDNGWPGSAQTQGAELKPWAYDLMYSWHINDPVSQKETDRNNAIYQLQNNRNPFIDNPAWVDSILFPVGVPKNIEITEHFNVFPNPAMDVVHIISVLPMKEISVFNYQGIKVLDLFSENLTETHLDISNLPPSYYFIHIRTSQHNCIYNLIKY
ncbi:MAG: endonuclease [Bacteroidales bacterium]|nr:endonuclease [Bacteroidales bacterium]